MGVLEVLDGESAGAGAVAGGSSMERGFDGG